MAPMSHAPDAAGDSGHRPAASPDVSPDVSPTESVSGSLSEPLARPSVAAPADAPVAAPAAAARPAVHNVALQPQGWRFDAPEDQTLLLAALDHGLRLPHSCRNGTCRACIARLVSGRIDYRIEWPGLSREEKDEGWILPCVACARSDLVLDQPQAINLFDVPPPPSARG